MSWPRQDARSRLWTWSADVETEKGCDGYWRLAGAFLRNIVDQTLNSITQDKLEEYEVPPILVSLIVFMHPNSHIDPRNLYKDLRRK